METTVPIPIEYRTEQPVPLSDVIESLTALQTIINEATDLLPGLVDGLEIQSVSIRLQSLEEGSLRELVLVSLFLAFQEDLVREVPPMIEKLTGLEISDDFNTLVTVVTLITIFYGVGFITDIIQGKVQDTPLRRKYNELLSELETSTGKDKSEINRVLDRRYAKTKRLHKLGKASVKLFSPSKRQGNAEVSIGGREIESTVVREIPEAYTAEDELDSEIFRDFESVEIEIHAQDRDKGKSGWAGLIEEIVPNRVRMRLLNEIKPESLWQKERITADVTVKYTRVGDDFEPNEIHLRDVYEAD